MAGTSLFADTTASNQWLGLGASAGRIDFDDQTTDEINFLDTNIGIGTSTPQHKLDVNGNIGIVTSGYINFGTTGGETGYGVRDYNGIVQAKNSSSAWSQVINDFILIREELPSGTDAGTFTSGSWQARKLNAEVVDTANLASLASYQITLLPGTYRINSSAPSFAVNQNQTRFYNITDDVTALVGTTEISPYVSENYVSSSVSRVVGEFTITSTKTFELQHRCVTTKSSNGFGPAASFGEVEIYSVVELWKIR